MGKAHCAWPMRRCRCSSGRRRRFRSSRARGCDAASSPARRRAVRLRPRPRRLAEVVDDPRRSTSSTSPCPTICTRRSRSRAAQAGKHILCEKPLARTADEARAMFEAVADGGRDRTWSPSTTGAPPPSCSPREIIEGAIGTILNFRGTYLQDWSGGSGRRRCRGASRGRSRDPARSATSASHVHRHRPVSRRRGRGRQRRRCSTYIPDGRCSPAASDQLGRLPQVRHGPRGTVDVDDEVLTLLRFAERRGRVASRRRATPTAATTSSPSRSTATAGRSRSTTSAATS